MPRVADLPPGWPRFSTADKIEHLLGMSLDRAYEILSWPITEPDPLRRSLQVQVIRVVMRIAGKALLNGSLDREVARERERDRILDRLVSGLRTPP
jgi:hypothetical protein